MFEQRAAKLGRNMAANLGKHRATSHSAETIRHLPDLPRPHDHRHRATQVECPLCGITGKLTIENGQIKVNFPLHEQDRSRLAFGACSSTPITQPGQPAPSIIFLSEIVHFLETQQDRICYNNDSPVYFISSYSGGKSHEKIFSLLWF
jgi:hypothetical protein